MTRRSGLFVAVLVGIVAADSCTRLAQAADAASAAASAGPLKVLKTFEIGGSGGFDYISVDSDARRLYASRATRVMVIDADKGTLIGEVADTPGVHGIALVPGTSFAVSSNGKESMLSVFDTKTLKTLRKIKAVRNPDSIIYDPASKMIFAFNHSSGDITIADPIAAGKAPVTVAVGGALETGVADGAGHVYVAVEDKSEIAAVDSKQGKVLAKWSLAPADGPTGLAIDTARRRLYAGCSGNQKMAVVDADSGKVLATLPTGKGVDACAFDPTLGLAVSADGRDGTMTVIQEKPAGTFTVVQTLKTATSAKTLALDPKTHQIYLPCNIKGADGNRFSIIVVGPAAAK